MAESNTVAVATASRKPAHACSASPDLPPGTIGRGARTTNAIERLHEEFKRRSRPKLSCLHSETARCVLGLAASGQINMRKVEDGKTASPNKPIAQPIGPRCLTSYVSNSREPAFTPIPKSADKLRFA